MNSPRINPLSKPSSSALQQRRHALPRVRPETLVGLLATTIIDAISLLDPHVTAA